MGVNRSAIVLAWMKAHLALDERARTPSSVAEGWQRTATTMSAHSSTNLVDLLDWESDIWLCKSTSYAGDFLHSVWTPPDQIDAWASAAPPSIGKDWRARPTTTARVDALVLKQKPMKDKEAAKLHARAVDAYFELAQDAVSRPAQREAIVLNQIIAWLDTAIGGWFKGVFLTPLSSIRSDGPPPELILSLTLDQRLRTVAGVRYGSQNIESYGQGPLVAMYNSRVGHDGEFYTYLSRVGQSELWRERWGWLTLAAPPADVMRGVQLAAQIMANPVLVGALAATVASPNDAERFVALCTLRRMLLTLRVLT